MHLLKVSAHFGIESEFFPAPRPPPSRQAQQKGSGGAIIFVGGCRFLLTLIKAAVMMLWKAAGDGLKGLNPHSPSKPNLRASKGGAQA